VFVRTFTACAAAALLATSIAGAGQPDRAVRAGRVHTVSSGVIEDGVVLIEDGKIAAVGPASKVQVPAGIPVYEAAVVTPGLVDVHSVVGFAGIYNSSEGQVQDQDQLETSSPVQPQLRAVDAYDPVEPLVAWVRQLGVTTVHTGHGPGAVISGQTLVAKTTGETVEEAVVVESAALAATLGTSVSSNFESPGTRAKTAAELRAALVAADDYRRKRGGEKAPDRDLAKETLARALDGELALMITAHTSSEIATALRLQREFGFRLWLDGAAEAYRMIEPLREAGAPVLLHPTMARASSDLRNAAFDTAARLAEAGIPFALQSGFEGYVPKTRVLLYEAQVAVRYGLSPGAALEAITLSGARILGLDDRIGSIEPGKDADLVLFDGDPFEYTSHVCAVLIEGEPVSEECR
jgi:imidazolonepropionase-like amidohydrolase